jgi:hypothetical protein
LDWNRVPSEKAQKLRSALNASKALSSATKPKGFHETVQTFTLDVTPKIDISEFREYFDELSEDECTKEIEKRSHSGGFTTIPFDPDYVEDENGDRISHTEIIECVHGIKEPILIGHPRSVLSRKLQPPQNLDKWSVETANAFDQFLEVTANIARSEWFRTPPKVSYVASKAGPAELVEMHVPNVEKTMAILAFVRQIFSGHRQDGLFLSICTAFAQHCGDGGKIIWMNERASAFSDTLGKSNGFFDLGGKTSQEVLDMFLYGAGLMHAKPHSQYKEDEKLAVAIGVHGRERVISAFHFALHSVMRVPFSAHAVVRQEFSHWLDNFGFTPPSRVPLNDLFANVEHVEVSAVDNSPPQ